MMLTLAVLNRKGGVGKTSLTLHLAGAYAAKGKRVLLLDLDPQASLTQTILGGAEAADRLPQHATVAALFSDADVPPERLIVPTPIAGIKIVPGTEAMDPINKRDPGPYQTAVRELVATAAGEHDLAIIDCPPTLYLCSWCALVAADRVVVPIVPDQFGAHSLTAMADIVSAARARNDRLSVLGFVLNMLQSSRELHKMYEGIVREMYGPHVLINSLPLLADYASAAAMGKPVEQWKKQCRAAKLMRAVADELWLRAWSEENTAAA